MDRRIAAVFYLDVKYGSTKGGVTAGQTMLSATTGHDEAKAGRRYAMARVVGEVLTDDAGSTDAMSGTVKYSGTKAIINRENIKVYDADGTLLGIGTKDSTAITDATDDSSGVTGTMSVNGVYDIDFSNATPASGSAATITYDYQYDLVDEDADNDISGVPEVDVGVRQETVEAIDFPLRAKYSIGAQIDMMKAHGISKLVPSYSNVCRKAA